MTALILVEGESDRVALEVFAHRLGLSAPRVLAIGGAHAAARVVAELQAESPSERLIGLVDAGERAAFERVIEQVFTCDRDLEDELIRALGLPAVFDVIAREDEMASFRRLQRQPAQRERSELDQVRRFLHGRSGNKARYAALFAQEIALDRVPEPIVGALMAAAG